MAFPRVIDSAVYKFDVVASVGGRAVAIEAETHRLHVFQVAIKSRAACQSLSLVGTLPSLSKVHSSAGLESPYCLHIRATTFPSMQRFAYFAAHPPEQERYVPAWLNPTHIFE